MKEVAYSRDAIKTLRRMPANVSANIRQKIETYAADPAALSNNVVKLQGVDGSRLRVGDWRVIFDEDETVISIIKIASRGSVY